MFKKLNPFTGTFDYVDLPPGGYYVKNGNDLELWWKGQKMHTYVYEPPVAASGSPMGFLMLITNA